MGGGFQVSIRIYFHTLSKPKLRLFKVGNLLRPKGDAGIKKIPVFTDSTGNHLTQEFMGLSPKSSETSIKKYHLMISRSKLRKDYG